MDALGHEVFTEARRRNQDIQVEGTRCVVFVSCGMASNPGQHDEARQKYVEKILIDVNISDAVDVSDAFGGVYDLSSSPMGFLDKRMLSMAAKQMAKDGVSVAEGVRNDLRDWDKIRAFADHFAQLVKGG